MLLPSKEPNPSRRGALKKIALGAGAVTTLPILGQASPVGSLGSLGHAHDGMSPAHHGPMGQTGPATGIEDWKPLFFDEHQNRTVIALTDLIIPETDTPGAKTALVNRFMDLWLNDEEVEEQKRVIEGLAWIDGRSFTQHGKPFVELTSEEQTALLTPLADPGNKNPEDEPGVRFFDQLKELTIFGYYSSKPGLEQELQYAGDTYNLDFPGACTHPEHQS